MRVISALVHEANRVAHGKGGEGPLFVSSNGAQVESAPWFPFLTMYDLLINRPFPNNLFFFEKPALVSS